MIMSDHTESESERHPALCTWCAIPLGSANHYKKLVCVRCYKLLINAGLTDEEIFSNEN